MDDFENSRRARSVLGPNHVAAKALIPLGVKTKGGSLVTSNLAFKVLQHLHGTLSLYLAYNFSCSIAGNERSCEK